LPELILGALGALIRYCRVGRVYDCLRDA